MIRLLVASALIGLVMCDNKTCGQCPPTPKVYEELRCVGVLDNDGCCFERFELFCFEMSFVHTKHFFLDLIAPIGIL